MDKKVPELPEPPLISVIGHDLTVKNMWDEDSNLPPSGVCKAGRCFSPKILVLKKNVPIDEIPH